MILLCGIPSDPPLALVREELDDLGADYAVVSQRRFDELDLEFSVEEGSVAGVLRVGGVSHRLDGVSGVYTRLMDDRLLPELAAEPPASPRRARCRALHDTLASWLEIAPARVVNRSRPQGSNFSKPYQSQLIREHGFAIPETLITNEPELVRAFADGHARVVYKSMSAVRSIVQTLAPADFGRLDRIRWCPVQFQAYVEGTNVRVHVVGDEVFATAIATDVTDYRYAHHENGSAELTALDLPDELAERCVRLAAALELPFAGIDLKLAPDGVAYCFEVNPSPAFSYYENSTGQPIARALARYLAGG